MFSTQQRRYLAVDSKYLKSQLIPIVGWCTTIGCSFAMLMMVKYSSLNWVSSNFIVIFTIALGMWVFRLVPESVPAIFIIVCTSFQNISTKPIILSGFVSDGFFLTISLFGIGAVLIKSRFFYRIAVYILYNIAPSHSILQKTIFFMGTIMTPIISVQSSRVALMAPFIDDILASGRIQPRSNAANALASAAFNGCILLSTIFLTGKSSNAILYSMLNDNSSEHLSWFNWLQAASFPGLLLIGSFFFMQQLFFEQNDRMKINKFRLRKEQIDLGRFSIEERSALLSIGTLIIGLFFSLWFHIPFICICLAVFFVLLATGALELHELKTHINWTFLFYLGAIIGIMRYIQDIGIDALLDTHLYWFLAFTQDNLALFIMSVYLISWACGLVLGTMTAPALLFTVFLPIAHQANVNSWVVAFVILMATEAWVFPYQSSYYLCFEELLKKKQNFQLTPLLLFNASLVLVKLLILFASIPFWRWLGII